MTNGPLTHIYAAINTRILCSPISPEQNTLDGAMPATAGGSRESIKYAVTGQNTCHQQKNMALGPGGGGV